jgi:hypothetical protein
MTNPIIKIVDLSTGEEEVRPMNAKELASHLASEEEQLAIIQAALAQKAIASSAVAKLEALGLTAEEIAALVG